MSRRYSTLFTDDAPASSVDPARPYHLLFVDDDPGILSALRRVFHRENYALLFADSAEQALAILEENSVEVIISDFKMPGMDGNELLRIVRERWPQTLRIMLTGYANSEVVMGSMRDGAVYRFNLKPWNDDDLRLTVALALEQYEARRRKRTSSALSSPLGAAVAGRSECGAAQPAAALPAWQGPAQCSPASATAQGDARLACPRHSRHRGPWLGRCRASARPAARREALRGDRSQGGGNRPRALLDHLACHLRPPMGVTGTAGGRPAGPRHGRPPG